MFFAESAGLTPDDVCVRCKVRNASSSKSPVFGVFVEMTCTMRTWRHTEEDQTAFVNRSPEILLFPVHVDLSLRPAAHFGKSNSYGPDPSLQTGIPKLAQGGGRSQSDGVLLSWGMELETIGESRRKPRSRNGYFDHVGRGSGRPPSPLPRSSASNLQSFSVPLKEIISVDADISMSPQRLSREPQNTYRNEESVMQMDTQSTGLFELHFDNKNSYDILIAFLQASLPRNRIVNKARHSQRAKTAGHVGGEERTLPSRKTRSMDMDGFMAKEINESVENESASDRFRRSLRDLGDRLGEFVEHMTGPECLLCEGSHGQLRSPNKAPPFYDSAAFSPHSNEQDPELQMWTNFSYEQSSAVDTRTLVSTEGMPGANLKSETGGIYHVERVDEAEARSVPNTGSNGSNGSHHLSDMVPSSSSSSSGRQRHRRDGTCSSGSASSLRSVNI